MNNNQPQLNSVRAGGLPHPAASQLSGPARRLLAALAEPGAAAIPDPTRDGFLIVRTGRGGVSLGRGSHRTEAAEELARHDLATRSGRRGSSDIWAVSDAGLAHGRRAGAADDGFAAQHLDIQRGTVRTEVGVEKVTVNAAESPLEWLRRRKDRDGEPLIDAASFEAGERLRRDLTTGGVLPSVTARWEGGIGRGEGGLRDPAAATDAMVAARQRVRRALDATGSDYAGILIDVCGFLKGLELIERERGWPQRSAKVVVRLALRRLAEHYGLWTEARGPDRSRGLRSWALDDAVPASG